MSAQPLQVQTEARGAVPASAMDLALNRRLIRAQATAAMREARPRHTRGRYLVRRLRPSRVARAAAAVRAILELTRRRPGKDR